MEAGARMVKMMTLLDGINKSTDMLKKVFPRLLIGTVVNKPYTHVILRASAQPNLAPLESMAVLEDEFIQANEIELEEPIEEFPSDLLVAKLALIA